MVAPNSPSARAHARTAPGRQLGRQQRERDAAEHVPRATPRGGGRVLQPRSIERSPASAASMNERYRDERRREHGAGGRERQLEPEGVVEPAPDHAAAPQRREQRDAAHDRWKHEGQDDDCADDRPTRRTAPRASTHAIGSPRSTESAGGQQRDTTSERRSAIQAPSLREGPADRSDHGARINRPASGRATNATPMRGDRDDGGVQSPPRGSGHDVGGGRNPNVFSVACPAGAGDVVHELLAAASRSSAPVTTAMG